MIKILSTILILISSLASVYHSVLWVRKPEIAMLYLNANFSKLAIQLLSIFLGIGGLLLLLPPTFKIGGALLITHSIVTIICYVISKDLKGGFVELTLLLIPIFLIWVGYPVSVLEKFQNFLS